MSGDDKDLDASALLGLIQTRRSVRRFRPDAVPRPLVERVLEAAVSAPSASNKQPWRFYVVTDQARIARMAAAVRTEIDAIAAHVDPAFVEAFREYGTYFLRFAEAPAVIAPLCRGITVLSHMVGPALADERRAAIAHMEQLSGVVSTSAALQNLLLQAHAEGLGASIMTGPLVAMPALREILAVKPSWSLVALVPIGFPDESPSPPARRPADAVTRWLE